MLDVFVGAYQSSLGRYVRHDDVHAASVHAPRRRVCYKVHSIESVVFVLNCHAHLY